MTKKTMFGRIVKEIVMDSLTNVYNISRFDPTDNQINLSNTITNRLYDIFGNSLRTKELEQWISELHVPETDRPINESDVTNDR